MAKPVKVIRIRHRPPKPETLKDEKITRFEAPAEEPLEAEAPVGPRESKQVDDGMGRRPTGKSMRQRSTMLSETLLEVLKDRKAEEMREAFKAKLYEQEQLAKNVGSKAAEVVKSMDVDLSRTADTVLDRFASHHQKGMLAWCFGVV